MDRVDPLEFERRFRERAAELRRGYLWFVWGAMFVSLVLAAGLSLFLYLLLTQLLTWMGRTSLPSFRSFLSVYAGLFLVLGYLHYRRRPARAALAGWEQLFDRTSPWALVLHTLAPEVGLAALLFTLPALPFHFLEGILTGRQLFASGEVDSLAQEVLLEGGAKISPEFLQKKLDLHPRALGPALRLLVEMELLILVKAGGRRILLRSTAGSELVEGKGTLAGVGGEDRAG
jgi:hypothetical protein